MARLPPEPDRVWLIDEIARLIAIGGERQFVRAPIRRGVPEDFPEPWSGDLPSLKTLASRLLRYAGLGKLAVAVVPFANGAGAAGTDGLNRWRRPSSIVWFAGIRAGVVTFGCVEDRLEWAGPERAGEVAREVARAWRSIHGIIVPERDREERLVDLTAVYLGFGALLANHANTRTARRDAATALPVEHLTLAFAAQILARRTSCIETWRLLRALDSAPRSAARAALRQLRPADPLRVKLGLHALDDPPPIDIERAGNRPPVGDR